jgi:sugar porter (SP) family MFS transporter
MEGIVVSVLLLGAVFGSLVAGVPADRIGRRWTIIISGVLFIAGSILASYLARNVTLLIIGRIIIGAAIGVTSAVTPLYIAEMAPPKLRGGLVMMYQLSITIGILIALGIGHALTPSGNWQLMILLAVIPAGAQIAGMAFVPESPRFLLRVGRRDEARAVLIRIRGGEAAADAELAEIEAVREEEGRVTWRDVFGPRFRGPMLAGIGLAVISALDGINAIMYYSTKMFKIAGQSNATMSSLAVGITNFGASVVSLWIVNSFRRRTLLFIGIVGQIAGLALAAAPLLVSHVSSSGGWVMVAGILLFVVCFAFSSGPLAWVIISEVFPLGARGKGAGVATACNWLANYVVAMVYPIAVGSEEGQAQQRRVGYSFVAFGIICFLSLFYIAAFVPETHQLSLEQIEEDFTERRASASARKSARKSAAAARRSSGSAANGDPSPLPAPGKRPMDAEAPPS